MTTKKLISVLCAASLFLAIPVPVQAMTATDLLQQQQELTADVNKNRSEIASLKADITRLNSKIKSSKAGLVENARAVQVANPSSTMVSMILSSRSLTELLEQVISINMIINTTNSQTKELTQASKDKSKALTNLDARQVSLDQAQQALTTSLEKDQEQTEAAVKFTPKTNGTESSPTKKAISSSSSQSSTESASSSSVVPTIPVGEAEARANIVARESGGDYSARNGRYYGAYQLDISLLKGDLSPANQDATAQAYVTQRYGSWSNAWSFWQANHWY